MGNDITTTTGSAIACATPYSTTSLAASIPDWLDRDAIDADMFYAPVLPAGSADALALAADLHRSSLTIPATHDQRTAILANLRLQTITREEHKEEARARFRLLRDAVALVPVEVLEEACARYVRRQKFFPTAVSELLTYTNAIMFDRKRTAHRLERLARAAREQDAERARLEADPVTEEGAAAARAEFGIGRARARASAVTAAAEPTVDEYLALGLSEQEARQALADRQRMLARGRAQPIGNALPDIEEAA